MNRRVLFTGIVVMTFCGAVGALTAWSLRGAATEDSSENDSLEGPAVAGNDLNNHDEINTQSLPLASLLDESVANVASDAADPAADASREQPDAILDDSGELALAGMLQRIDEHIESGAYGSAVRLLGVIRPSVPSELAAAVAFRSGLAAESLGEWTSAQLQYDLVIEQAASNKLRQLAAFGKVRCWNAAGDRVLARQALYQLAIDDAFGDRSVSEDAWHLLGNALAGDFAGPAADRWSLRNEELFTALPRVTAARCLTEARDSADVSADATTRPSAPRQMAMTVTQRIGDQPDGLILQAECHQEPVTNLLLHLAKAGGWELHADAAISQSLRLRRQTWRTVDVDAATWLDAILSGCDAYWRCEAGRLEILSNRESSVVQRQVHQQAQTQRALQQAVLRAPEHRWTAYTYLAWVRLSAAAGQTAEALRLCEQGLLSGTRVECDVELLLNSARLQWRLGERDAALRLLYRAVDVRPAHPLHATAYLSIARLQLENGLPGRAIPEAMRGLACCADSPLEPVAACLLASAHLLDGNPHGANAVLMRHRTTFRTGDYRDAAALLSALARFRATSDEEERRRVAGQLMEAVAHVDPQSPYGDHWWVLSIEALEATGLTTEADRQRQACLKATPRFPLRDRLLLATVREELAVASMPSRPVFELLTRGTDASVRAEALWANAEVHFRQREHDAALQACLELVQSTETPDELRRKALRLMGVIYQQRRDYQSAVTCFAGALPMSSAAGWPDILQQEEAP